MRLRLLVAIPCGEGGSDFGVQRQRTGEGAFSPAAPFHHAVCQGASRSGSDRLVPHLWVSSGEGGSPGKSTP